MPGDAPERSVPPTAVPISGPHLLNSQAPAQSSSPPAQTSAPAPAPEAPDTTPEAPGPPLTWTVLRKEARRFGVRKWRTGQRAVIEAVIAGKNVLAIMPTGAGKSLCYQLPALFLPKPTLVISPLLALMQDQYDKLADADIEAAKLDSFLTASEEREMVHSIEGGEHAIIYMTPERLENPASLEMLKQKGLSLVVVDEAHCISQWGHDFRPSYLFIRHALSELGNPPVLAITATAPPEVSADILKQLALPDAQVINTGIERENLSFEVFRTTKKQAKLDYLLELVRATEGIGIVYVATVRTSKEVSDFLCKHGVKATNYHAKLRPREREKIQQDFMHGRYQVMVATKAFGMGIDKADVRFVVHFHFPDSLETYYQEAGRGGRDERPARAVLLYRKGDGVIQRYFLRRKYPCREDSQRLWEALGRLCPIIGSSATTIKALVEATGLPKRRVKVIVAELEEATVALRKGRVVQRLCDFADEQKFEQFLSWSETRKQRDAIRLQTMMNYAESPLCRVRFLREYFGEDPKLDCGHCDNCRARAEEAKAA
jgi:ATP-dependent DNA helicase RecQ